MGALAHKVRLITTWFIAALFILLSFNSISQSNMVVEELAIGTDLPEGAVNSLVQDNEGFIWIATWKGLYRYDGYNVVNFTSINPNFNALKISKLLIEGNNLWVCSFVTGLYKINLTDYKAINYIKETDKRFQINDDNVISICALPDKTILIGTERGGLNVIGADGIVSKSYTTESHPELLRNNQVSAIIHINENTVAIGNVALLLFNVETESVIQIEHPQLNSHILDIKSLSSTEFLLSSYEGLFYLNIGYKTPLVDRLLDYRVKSIVKIENKYLITTFEGILEFAPNNKTISNFTFGESKRNTKLDINTLLYTHDNTIIVGSESGLYSLFQRKQHFNNLTSSLGNDSPDIISNIEKYQNTIFAGSWGKGILKLNSNNNLEPVQFSNYNNPSPRFIFTLKKIDDKIWFSDKNLLGIFCFDGVKEPFQLKYYQQFRGINNYQGTYTVTSLVETKTNSILLGTWEGLIFSYDKITDQFVAIKDRNGNLPSSQNLSIFSILEDHEGYTWIALSGGGVIRMKIIDNVIVSQEKITIRNGLVSNFTTTLYQSRNNKIWIGTEAGLSVYENGSLNSLYNKDIVLDIQSIIEDPIGFLWIGTQKGLIRINSNNIEEPFKLFDTSDGLINKSFYLNSLFVDDDYSFYFGGFNGIDYFTPYKIEFNYKKPIPKITNFTLFNERIYPSGQSGNDILRKNITATDTIKLKYNQNSFSFEFSNLEYQTQEKCQFAFKLDGIDNNWNFRDANQRYAYYTKLSPGTYLFNLQSTNNDGLWSDEKVYLTIIISPPLWASTLAYIIYFVAAMFTIFLIIYFKVMKVQEKHQQQLKEVEYKKQKELDELKLRFFTNISHEFRTPLTLILGPLARILETERNNPYKESHLMIFRNASRLLQLTNRILDFRKNEKEQLKLKVTPTNVSDFFYNIFLFFNYEAQKRDIDYRFKTNYDGVLLMDQEFMESVAFNLLSNAFKYTPNGKSISVNVNQFDGGAKFIVSDTGPGIKENELSLIFDRFYSTTKRNSAGIGLSFSKRLIELHKGELNVESKFGEGSRFTVILPANEAYTDDEKSLSTSKETVADWKKIDQSVQETVNNKINDLKSLFDKNEMIALVVDDNFEVRQFIASLLEKDFKVLEASNGEEALELAFNNIPDIVISDVMMPIMDGYELCQKLKTDQRTDHIPVILTTVLSSQTDRNEGLTKGADSYITKPIDSNHLIIRVNKLIEKQLKLKKKFNLQHFKTDNTEKKAPKPEVHPLVEKARDIVLKNLDNSEYNIDDFCNDLGLSRMQLYRKFKAITGLSANSFIRKVRLHKAAEMLKTGNFTVKEVTYDVGFIDLKYFRKCFYDEFGTNPSDYAQTRSKDEN